MKKNSFYFSILILVLCSGCFSKKEQFAPPDVYGYSITTTTIDSYSSDEVGITYTYYFSNDNTYTLFYKNDIINSGNFSYHVEGPQKAQIVATYSKNNQLKTYTSIYYFETPSSGTWKGSYLKSNLEGEHGTFKIKKNSGN